MSFYIYVSDSKLDMLYEQIPTPARRKLAAELKLDLKVVSLSLKANPSEDTRYGKLQVVIEDLEQAEKIGEPSDGLPYLRGRGEMKWGTINPSTVYFTGKLGNAIVGMGGATHHLGHGASAQPGRVTPSNLPFLLAALADANADANADERDASAAAIRGYEDWPKIVMFTTMIRSGVIQELEFVARRLAFHKADGATDGLHVVLASPLYVALAD